MNSVVRRVRCMLLLLLAGVAWCSTVVAQEVTRTTVAVRTGYTSFDLKDLGSVMQRVADAYANMGLPVRLQLDFPSNVVVGAEVVFPGAGYAVGFGGSYTNTKSGFGYRDEAGEVGVWTTVRAVSILASISTDLWTSSFLRIETGLRPGLFLAFVSLEERVKFQEPSFPQYDETTNLSGKGLTGEVYAGVRWSVLEGCELGAEAGMRYTPETTLRKDDAEFQAGLNVSGFFASVTVGVQL